MADEKKYYVFCGANCKYEGMTKEQIIAAIAEATGATVTDVDAAFITKVKEQNKGENLTFWIGSVAEFNAQKDIIPTGTECIILDDTTLDDIEAALKDLKHNVESLGEYIETEIKGHTIYNGDVTSEAAVTLDGLREYTHITLYTGKTDNVIDNGGIASSDGEIETAITFNIIETITTDGGGTVKAYATRLHPEDVTLKTVYELIIEHNRYNNEASVEAWRKIIVNDESVAAENIAFRKIVGFCY